MSERRAGLFQPFSPIPIGQQSVAANAHETVGQDVQQEAANEFLRRQAPPPPDPSPGVVLVAEDDLVAVQTASTSGAAGAQLAHGLQAAGDGEGRVRPGGRDVLWPFLSREGADERRPSSTDALRVVRSVPGFDDLRGQLPDIFIAKPLIALGGVVAAAARDIAKLCGISEHFAKRNASHQDACSSL